MDYLAGDSRGSKGRVLVVDDEESNCIVITRALQLMGYEVDSALNGRAALEKLSDRQFDVMLLDLKMPEMGGEKVLEQVQTDFPNLGVIVLTAHATLESAIGAVKAGAVDYLLKPQKIAEIEAAIRRALKKQEAAREKQHLVAVMENALQSLREPSYEENESATTGAALLHRGRLLYDDEHRSLTIFPRSSDQEKTEKIYAVLTETQAAILIYLLSNPAHVVDDQEIAAKALGYPGISKVEAERIVRPHIVRMRRKFPEDGETSSFIISVRGKGYCINPDFLS